ncbi:hypothetical protein [Salinarchaeum sp. Harcht-Bsk1]|uniref:hypothetical protein n=1 Tax=Salinarchaeum sp. Harcht-Bsk1 TaxID=1333523 RepID=UPI0009DB875D|nr:hypothetical protein [Salinarchaeum sp. Harcht-Bsk1]
MPYPTQVPNSIGHVESIKDETLIEDIGEFKYNPPSPKEANAFDSVPVRDLPGAEDLGPPFVSVYGLDGSRVEVPVGDPRFDKRIGVIDIALVELDLTTIDEQARQAYVTPSKVRNLGEEHHVRMALPSTNTRYNAPTVHESWRLMTFQNFQQKEVFGQSLFDIYYDLLDRANRLVTHGRIRLEQCPAQDCTYGQQFINSTKPDTCPKCGANIYPTDPLRVHERVAGSQSNEAALNVLMGLIEHMVLLGAADSIWNKNPEQLETTAFIKDGPLAQFDTAAWIHQPLHNKLSQFQRFLRDTNREPLVYMGIHKTGDFAAYAQEVRDYLTGPTVLPFSNDDIYEHVIAGDRTKDYAKKTYYGKNFLYKSGKGNGTGHCLPFLIPRRYQGGRLGEKKGEIVQNVDAYTELARAVSLLERLRTVQHKDGLIPLVLAHEAASIPEELGRRVFGRVAEEVAR